MKKNKVSELPLCKSFKGLFTLGTDANNRSCKVSLEFVEEAADAATSAKTATEEAREATSSAKTATAETLATLAILVPEGLAVDAPQEITLGNTAPQRIRAILSPENAMPNVVFISDNESVKIAPDGRIKVVRAGTSEVHIVPTCNTALAKTVLITVHTPTVRLADTRKILRLTAAGDIRLN